MKILILLVLIFIASFSYSQNRIKGIFCNSYNGGFSLICIEFKENSKFEFSTHGCLGIEKIGTGGYNLGSKKLILNFDKVETQQKSKLKVDNFPIHKSKDSVEIQFQILDGYNEQMPLPAHILLGSKSFDLKTGYQTNKSGEFTLLKKHSSKKEKYRILFMGYEQFEFELSNSLSKNVEIILAPAGPKIISDETFIYKIDKIKGDSIILKDGDKFIRFKS